MEQARLIRALDPVEDRAITNVLLRFGFALDTRDWQLFRSCFTEDLEADFGNVGRWRGLREITDCMRTIYEDFGETLHRITNVSIWADGGQVMARCYIDAILKPVDTTAAVRRGIGWYDDRIARTSDGWRISRRMFHPIVLE